LELITVDVGFLLVRQTPLELPLQRVGILQQHADIGPHGRIEPIQADGLILTDFCPTEAKRVHADAAVVRVGLLIVFVEPCRPLSVPGIATAATLNEPL